MKFVVFIAALVAVGCGNDDERPVPSGYHGSLPENPRTCGDVRKDGQAQEAQVLIDDVPAECVGDGVTCGVADLPQFSGVCVSGLPNAVCTSQHWAIRCDLDSGTGPVDGGDGG